MKFSICKKKLQNVYSSSEYTAVEIVKSINSSFIMFIKLFFVTSFRSQDEEIDLVPLDEFLRDAPESLKVAAPSSPNVSLLCL